MCLTDSTATNRTVLSTPSCVSICDNLPIWLSLDWITWLNWLPMNLPNCATFVIEPLHQRQQHYSLYLTNRPLGQATMPTSDTTAESLSSINLDNIRLSAPDDDDANDSGSESSFHDAGTLPTVSVEDDDIPPAFPSLNSAQRQSSSSTSKATPTPAPSKAAAFLQSVAPRPAATSNTLMAPPQPPAPARSGGLAAPPSTSALTAPAGVGGASGALSQSGKSRKKVALAPGCSPLDWARLKNSTDLRGGVTSLLRVTPSELKKHNKPEDAWSAFYGKVYNITPYLRFHPGGEDELMRCAGRDGTRLFGEYFPPLTFGILGRATC